MARTTHHGARRLEGFVRHPGRQLASEHHVRAATSRGSGGASTWTARRCSSNRTTCTTTAGSRRLENGSGYGLDVANSTAVTVRNNVIADNGNEGFHLSSLVRRPRGGQRVRRQRHGEALSDPRGRQRDPAQPGDGCELRGSRCGSRARTTFSYNVWAGSPLQWLENDNHDNTFFYERFEGRVVVGDCLDGQSSSSCRSSAIPPGVAGRSRGPTLRRYARSPARATGATWQGARELELGEPRPRCRRR